MYSHLLFDMDDTIFDFQKAQLVSFKRVLERYDILFSPDLYHNYEEINHTLWRQFDAGILSKDTVQNTRFSRFFKSLGLNADGESANSFYQSCLATQTWLLPYAQEVCEELSRKCILFFVTNGVGKTQKSRFRLSEVYPYFTNIFVSEELGVAKPSRVFFEKTLKYINYTKKDEILLIGDSLTSDIQGAINFGIDCCWFNPNNLELEKEMQPTFSITDLRQLLDIV